MYLFIIKHWQVYSNWHSYTLMLDIQSVQYPAERWGRSMKFVYIRNNYSFSDRQGIAAPGKLDLYQNNIPSLFSLGKINY